MRTLESFIRRDKDKETKNILNPKEQPNPEAGGFIIDSIEMKKFMRYLDKTRIVFPEKFTVIVGSTGSGKTTILDAITFALYKSTSRTDLPGVKIEDVCKNDGYVQLFFYQGKNKYGVKRGLTNNGKSYVTLKINDEPIPGSIPEIDEKIKDIVGLDYTGFRNSTFVRQEEMKQLGSETGSERLEIFQKLFRLEIFGKAQERVSEKVKKTNLDLERIVMAVELKKEYVSEIPEKKKNLEEKKTKMGYEKVKLKMTEKMMEEKEKELKELLGKHEEFLKVEANIESAKKSLSNVDTRLEKAFREAEGTKVLKDEAEKLEKETKNIEMLRMEADGLKEKIQKLQSLKNEKEIYEKQEKGLRDEYEKEAEKLLGRLMEKEKRIKGLRTEINKDKAFSLLRTQGKLDERISRIEKEVEWLKDRLNIVEKLREEQKTAKENLKEISEDVLNINVDSFLLSEIENEIIIIKKDLEKKEKDYKKKTSMLSEDMKNIEKKISSLGVDEEEEKRLEKLRTLISDMQKKKEILEMKKKKLQEIGDVSKLINDLKTQKEEIVERIKILSSRLEVFDESEKRYTGIGEEIKQLQNKKMVLTNKISGFETEIRMLEKEVEELENIRKEIDEIEKKEKELRKKLETYSLLKEQVFHKKGIVMYAINKLMPHLEIEASKNLSDLTDSRFNNVKMETYEENKKYGVKINVVGPDTLWHDVQEFSGGERTQINAALRFAIAKELSSLPQVGKTYGRMKTLFIDEGDLGSLDTEVSRELFVKKLFDMGKFFEKIILITHLTEVSERFASRIQIGMTANGESRVEVAR